MSEPIQISPNFLQLETNKINHIYGFKFLYPNSNIKIHYQVTLKFLGYNDNTQPVISIDRLQTYLNNQEPEGIIYEMADKMLKSIYPIHFSMNKNNEILTIENHKTIVISCQQTEKELSNYYVGKSANKIITNFNSQYNSVDTLIYQLQNDLFFKLLFFPLHHQYNINLKAETTIKLHIEKKEVILPVYQTINPNYSETEKIEISLLGLQNSDKITTFKLFYNLYPTDYAVASIIGKIGYKSKNGDEIIEVECYHLKN